jgi:tetratricopeptide (TPR) repeat protein
MLALAGGRGGPVPAGAAFPARPRSGRDGGSEAVALFAERARSADPGFVLDGQTGPVLAQIVARLDGMPLAIELAAARAEALGVGQLLDRLDDRFALLAGADRLAPERQRSLGAAVEWSYRLLGERERRVFRAVSVFPAGFTLEAAEAVAGPGAGPGVLHLVDCSLLSPPRAGPDGRARYVLLETLRGYGAGLLAKAGEHDDVAATLAGWALGVAEQAAADLQTSTGEQDAARWLDAEDATMRQVLAWGIGRDREAALRLAGALCWWWFLRGRLSGLYPLLAKLAGYAEPGSDRWCTAQVWAGLAAWYSDPAVALRHSTAVRDAVAGRPPSRALADALNGRSRALLELGQFPEAAEDARRALAVAREVGYPNEEVHALLLLACAVVLAAGDAGEAVRLARQADQVPGDIAPAMARLCSGMLALVLIEIGDFAAAEPACAAALAAHRDAGDLWHLPELLYQMGYLDLRAGRTGDAAAHLREALELALRTGAMHWRYLDVCGYLCAATGRPAEAVTMWAAHAARGPAGAGTGPGAGGRAARRGDEPGRRGRVRPAAHRAPRPAAARGAAGAGQAQRPGAGASHPGRPGRHQRADRRPAVHQRPHGQLAPGPDPGQDRRAAPRRPDQTGPGRRPGLAAGPADRPARQGRCGSFAPPRRRAEKGSADPCRPHRRAGEPAW